MKIIMLGSLTKEQKDLLRTLPLKKVIRYWVEINNLPVLKDSSRQDREYKLSVTQKIINLCPLDIQEKTIPEMTQSDLITMFSILATSDSFDMKDTTRLKWQKFMESIFNYCFQKGIISENPAYAWPKQTCYSVPTKIVDPSVLAKLLSTEPTDFHTAAVQLFIIIALETGFRVSSICKFEIADLVYGYKSSDEKVVREVSAIAAKFGSNYQASISPVASKIIMDYLEKYTAKDGSQKFLFLTEKGNELTTSRAEDRIEDYCVKLGVQHITPHMLRATFATFLADRTSSPDVIMDALGVNSRDTALRYIRDAEMLRNRNFVRDLSILSTVLNYGQSDSNNSDRNVPNDSIVGTIFESNDVYEKNNHQHEKSINSNNLNRPMVQMNIPLQVIKSKDSTNSPMGTEFLLVKPSQKIESAPVVAVTMPDNWMSQQMEYQVMKSQMMQSQMSNQTASNQMMPNQMTQMQMAYQMAINQMMSNPMMQPQMGLPMVPNQMAQMQMAYQMAINQMMSNPMMQPQMGLPMASNQMVSNQMMSNQMMPNQMMPNQMMPNQMMPNQMMPNQMGNNTQQNVTSQVNSYPGNPQPDMQGNSNIGNNQHQEPNQPSSIMDSDEE